MSHVDPNLKHMQRALMLAKRGLGRVEPNPMVGCVLVSRGKVIGEGFHGKFGRPHAEVEALTDCKKRANDPRGCDVFVTLEPCSHHGKTPPCVDALIEAKVRRVFVAMGDPFAQVDGQGVEKLKAAGIDVKVGLCANEARELNRAFVKRVTIGLPWTIAKWAQTIDGHIATRAGDSQWISNEKSRANVHQLRGRVDAIMVGIGTVLADDPSLTARDVKVKRVARRIVVDPALRLPMESKLVTSLSAGGPPVTVIARNDENNAVQRRELEEAGVEVCAMAGEHMLVDALRSLTDTHGLTNLLVEGGATLISSFFAKNMIDEAQVYVAPKWLGDAQAAPAIHGFERTLMKEAETLSLQQITRFDDDVLLTYRARSQIK